MSFLIYYRRHLALGQKNSADAGIYGQGFNYVVEAGFRQPAGTSKSAGALADALKVIDHRLLGLDVNIIENPTSQNICRWLYATVKAKDESLYEIRLLRGDGLNISCKG